MHIVIKLMTHTAGCYYNYFVKSFGYYQKRSPRAKKLGCLFSQNVYESYLSDFNTVRMFQVSQGLPNQTGQKLVHRIMCHVTQTVVAGKQADDYYLFQDISY